MKLRKFEIKKRKFIHSEQCKYGEKKNKCKRITHEGFSKVKQWIKKETTKNTHWYLCMSCIRICTRSEKHISPFPFNLRNYFAIAEAE